MKNKYFEIGQKINGFYFGTPFSGIVESNRSCSPQKNVWITDMIIKLDHPMFKSGTTYEKIIFAEEPALGSYLE